jgi:hypothetical protein
MGQGSALVVKQYVSTSCLRSICDCACEFVSSVSPVLLQRKKNGFDSCLKMNYPRSTMTVIKYILRK